MVNITNQWWIRTKWPNRGLHHPPRVRATARDKDSPSITIQFLMVVYPQLLAMFMGKMVKINLYYWVVSWFLLYFSMLESFVHACSHIHKMSIVFHVFLTIFSQPPTLLKQTSGTIAAIDAQRAANIPGPNGQQTSCGNVFDRLVRLTQYLGQFTLSCTNTNIRDFLSLGSASKHFF